MKEGLIVRGGDVNEDGGRKEKKDKKEGQKRRTNSFFEKEI